MQIHLPDADIEYFEGFIKTLEAETYFKQLYRDIAWRTDTIKLFGKEVIQPRKTYFMGDERVEYSYSNLRMKANPWTSLVQSLKTLVEGYTGAEFNACLLNLYRDGNDSNGWHADDEAPLGKNPFIASLSFGSERSFHLKHRKLPDARWKLNLAPGSLLIMKGTTQTFYKHQIPKTKRKVSPRINLTFRKILY
ncbi:MAG: alpha-ketoglutarate-dependent dioxygenase AlkB [Flavobacteriaceae bacterium]|nr:alpha-ketoglutarate-dependent dioxygenase AlkB [Flavobacteriaceae bacterium]